jgi:hypothetical protein
MTTNRVRSHAQSSLLNAAAWMAAAALLLPSRAWADGVKEVEISSDPPEDGEQVFTVRIRPSKNRVYEKIVFDCFLHQEFQWENERQSVTNKVHEPAVYTYRRKDVKLVEDLDCFVSFRVPVGMERLRDIYGVTAFNTNAPVTVSRMKITGYKKDASVWRVEVPANGLHVVDAPATDAEKPAAEDSKPPAP